MALTEDYTLEVVSRSLIAGADTNYIINSDPPPRGFTAALPEVRSADNPAIGDGDSFGIDTYGPRLLFFTAGTVGPTPVLARQQADALTQAWRKTSRALRLDVRLPGSPETVMSYFGRPRGAIDGGDWYYDQGYLAVDLAFAAEPFPYGAERSLVGQTGTFILPDEDMGRGGTLTTRATIVVKQNGGTPVITHTATDVDGRAYERDITFTGAVSTDTTLTLGPTEQTAMQGTTSVIGQVSDASRWPELVGGVDNTFTVSGCAGIDITWRPAYY